MPPDPARKSRLDLARTFALAMELPIILVVAPAIGFFVGQWLDERWNTSFLALLLGLLGFVGGVREVLRRIPKNGQGSGKPDAQDGDGTK